MRSQEEYFQDLLLLYTNCRRAPVGFLSSSLFFSLVQDLRTSSGQYGEGSNVPVQSLALPSSSSLAISRSLLLFLCCVFFGTSSNQFSYFFLHGILVMFSSRSSLARSLLKTSLQSLVSLSIIILEKHFRSFFFPSFSYLMDRFQLSRRGVYSASDGHQIYVDTK